MRTEHESPLGTEQLRFHRRVILSANLITHHNRFICLCTFPGKKQAAGSQKPFPILHLLLPPLSSQTSRRALSCSFSFMFILQHVANKSNPREVRTLKIYSASAKRIPLRWLSSNRRGVFLNGILVGIKCEGTIPGDGSGSYLLHLAIILTSFVV